MDINQACEAFRKILEEQQARVANMNTEKTDFSTKKTVTIGVVDGDGCRRCGHQHGAENECQGDCQAAKLLESFHNVLPFFILAF